LNCANIAAPIKQGQHEERVARGEIVDPQQEWRLAHFHALEQNPVEGDEKGDLNQHGQATGERVYFSFLYSSIMARPSFSRSSLKFPGFVSCASDGAHFAIERPLAWLKIKQ